MSLRSLDRMRRTADEAAGQGLVAIVVAPSPDLVYLTGYDPPPLERPTFLIVRPDRDPVMVVPRLERSLAAASAAGERIELVGWEDGVDPYALAAGLLPPAGRVAAGDRMWATHVLGLQRAAPGLDLEPAGPIVGRIRAIKDEDELAALRRAARAADEAFRRIADEPFLGRREAEVAADLAELLIAHGHARADFTIVASGPNAASPHHQPGDRRIQAKDAVVLDFGGELGGYHSDTTRTLVVGEPPLGFERVYQLVQEAQQAACDAVRPGARAHDVDRAARQPIVDAGYGDAFFHRTGHGIGLEVHEPPWIAAGNQQALETGMTFSVEPGVYLEDKFGVRIEDIVAVTDDGVEHLNRSPRGLLVVD
jgi:D-alanyl-D-alanine dipeptidase